MRRELAFGLAFTAAIYGCISGKVARDTTDKNVVESMRIDGRRVGFSFPDSLELRFAHDNLLKDVGRVVEAVLFECEMAKVESPGYFAVNLNDEGDFYLGLEKARIEKKIPIFLTNGVRIENNSFPSFHLGDVVLDRDFRMEYVPGPIFIDTSKDWTAEVADHMALLMLREATLRKIRNKYDRREGENLSGMVDSCSQQERDMARRIVHESLAYSIPGLEHLREVGGIQIPLGIMVRNYDNQN